MEANPNTSPKQDLILKAVKERDIDECNRLIDSYTSVSQEETKAVLRGLRAEAIQELEEKSERLENSFDPESGNLDALGKTER